MRLIKDKQIERPLGSVIIDLPSDRLTSEDRDILLHSSVGGVILFTRNFENVDQITALVKQIHGLRNPPLLVCVDHEGGRVQRFKEGFTLIPAMRKLGVAYDKDAQQALTDAHTIGWLLAAELRACQVDFSFTPVLDLDHGYSTVIDDRAFHHDPTVVSHLATAFMEGLRDAGMISVGKHFPGHGFVMADSHYELPIDERDMESLIQKDLVPFVAAKRAGLDAIMPAHVVYAQIDPRPAGFSPFWIRDILRKEIGFSGVVFSDDLSMEGAKSAGGIVSRAETAFDAGCDVILVCNDRDGAVKVLDELPRALIEMSKVSLETLYPKFEYPWDMKALQEQADYQFAQEAVKRISAFETPKEAVKIAVVKPTSGLDIPIIDE